MATCGSCCERTGDEQLHVIAIQVAESLENTDDASEQEPVGDQMSMNLLLAVNGQGSSYTSFFGFMTDVLLGRIARVSNLIRQGVD
ncbi:unnamed protein product [Symbiodinium sp. KB8]|nr:unnamed protein product [Symbiodinium sp. KB8]